MSQFFFHSRSLSFAKWKFENEPSVFHSRHQSHLSFIFNPRAHRRAHGNNEWMANSWALEGNFLSISKSLKAKFLFPKKLFAAGGELLFCCVLVHGTLWKCGHRHHPHPAELDPARVPLPFTSPNFVIVFFLPCIYVSVSTVDVIFLNLQLLTRTSTCIYATGNFISGWRSDTICAPFLLLKNDAKNTRKFNNINFSFQKFKISSFSDGSIVAWVRKLTERRTRSRNMYTTTTENWCASCVREANIWTKIHCISLSLGIASYFVPESERQKKLQRCSVHSSVHRFPFRVGTGRAEALAVPLFVVHSSAPFPSCLAFLHGIVYEIAWEKVFPCCLCSLSVCVRAMISAKIKCVWIQIRRHVNPVRWAAEGKRWTENTFHVPLWNVSMCQCTGLCVRVPKMVNFRYFRRTTGVVREKKMDSLISGWKVIMRKSFIRAA